MLWFDTSCVPHVNLSRFLLELLAIKESRHYFCRRLLHSYRIPTDRNVQTRVRHFFYGFLFTPLLVITKRVNMRLWFFMSYSLFFVTFRIVNMLQDDLYFNAIVYTYVYVNISLKEFNLITLVFIFFFFLISVCFISFGAVSLTDLIFSVSLNDCFSLILKELKIFSVWCAMNSLKLYHYLTLIILCLINYLFNCSFSRYKKVTKYF